MCVRAVGMLFFPLDDAWGLDESVYSPELKRQMSWLCGLLPYAQAEAVMARIGKRHISDSSLWRIVQQDGERLVEGARGANQSHPPSALPQTKLMSMDGAWSIFARKAGKR